MKRAHFSGSMDISPVDIHIWEGGSVQTRAEALNILSEGATEGLSPALSAKVLAHAEVREESVPTYLEDGLAVPHARVAGLPGISLMAAYLPAGVPWPDEEHTADFVIFIAVPMSQVSDYLFIIRKIIRWHKSVPAAERSARWGDPVNLKAELQSILS